MTYQKFKKPSVRCFTSDLCKRPKREREREREREKEREKAKEEVLAIVRLKKEPIQGSITATVEYVLFPMVVSSLFQLYTPHTD